MNFPHIIDSTMRADAVSCPQKFFNAHMRGLKLEAENVHLHFGGCFARGIERTRVAYYGEGLSAEEAITSGGCAIIEAWGEFSTPEGYAKSLVSCLDAHFSYFQQYPLATDAIRPLIIDGKPCVEFSFALPIGLAHPETGRPILYAGRFDMLGYFNDAIFICDEKTTGQLGESWDKQWQLRSQITGYIWGAKSFGYSVQGCIIRGVGILKRDITFKMIIQQRPQWMIDRWYEQLHKDVERLIKCYENDYFDYNLDNACSDFGGCPYLALCTSNTPERWESDYVTKFWNPLTRGVVDEPEIIKT